jgi:tetratricopeptide (TPR) repeat protein
MSRYFWYLCLIPISSLTVSSLDSQTPDAKTELSLGIAAYERGADEETILHLERAVSLDPTSKVARFYLALAYEWKCRIDCETHWSELAIQEYNRVLDLDPSDRDAIKSLAHFLYMLARFDEAEALYRKVAKLDADDPEALYAIAVFDWRRSYRVLVEERVRLNLSPKQPVIGLPACHEIRTKTLPEVEEGIALLTRTLQLVNYLEPQTYMAVLYQERADLHCGDRAAYQRDMASEKQWWNRACVTWRTQKQSSSPTRWLPGQPPPPPKRGDTCGW